jgi:hypothetical protein
MILLDRFILSLKLLLTWVASIWIILRTISLKSASWQAPCTGEEKDKMSICRIITCKFLLMASCVAPDQVTITRSTFSHGEGAHIT